MSLAASSAGTAVFRFDALGIDPVTDLGGVQSVRRSAAPAAGGLLISLYTGEGLVPCCRMASEEIAQRRLTPADMWRSLTLARCAATPGGGTGTVAIG